MADKPIPFSGPMIRALLDGRKTQTRRVLKPQPPEAPRQAWECAPGHTARHSAPYLDAYCGEPITTGNPRGMSRNWHWWTVDDRPGLCVTKTPYAPGDRLWVREAWRVEKVFDGRPPRDLPNGEIVARQYEAEGARKYWKYNHLPVGHLRQGMHMPRWASRLTLTVTDVRVQRVQEIVGPDAIAEGIQNSLLHCYGPACPSGPTGCNEMGCQGVRDAFRDLWNSLNAKRGYGWDANPWVAAYTFTVHHHNIDQMEQAA